MTQGGRATPTAQQLLARTRQPEDRISIILSWASGTSAGALQLGPASVLSSAIRTVDLGSAGSRLHCSSGMVFGDLRIQRRLLKHARASWAAHGFDSSMVFARTRKECSQLETFQGTSCLAHRPHTLDHFPLTDGTRDITSAESNITSPRLSSWFDQPILQQI
jgi:hypothetical protein